MDIKKYEDLVWGQARVLAKKFELARGDNYAIADLLEGFSKVAHSNDVAAVMSAMSSDGYRVDTMEWDDGPAFGKDVPFDEGVYEVLKDAFGRIHEGEY